MKTSKLWQLMINIGILKEPQHETRVIATPETIKGFIDLPAKVIIEEDAGIRASFPNEQYEGKKVEIVNRSKLLQQADIILSLNIPDNDDREKAGDAIWIGAFQAMNHAQALAEWSKAKQQVFSLDLLPRTTRAQSMDVLSSQSNIAGYKAVLVAANEYPRYFPMLMTAAGSIPPARVLIIGAGVAGLQAIATARRLGAVVHVSDTRPEVKEQVESLGGKFVTVKGAADASEAGGYAVEQSEEFKKRQKEELAKVAAKSDIIITTAQIPGRKAPIVITKEMIENMNTGSVIVDLAASTGGNTALTKNNETIVEYGVTIIGNSNLPAQIPADSSKLLGKNFIQFLKLFIDKEGNINPDFEDELIANACVCKGGEMINKRVKKLLA